MVEGNSEQLQGLCIHGNISGSCAICSNEAEPEGRTIINREGVNRAIAYKAEIKAKLEGRPGIIKNVLGLVEALESQPVGTTVDNDGIKVTYFQERNWSRNFRIEMNGDTYFLRKELGRGTGHQAMASFEEATSRFKDRKDIRLIDYQLGYTDNQGSDYFLAKWENLPVMADYLRQDLSDSEREELAHRLTYIYETLEDYKDVTTYNMFYDQENKQIVLFDLQKNLD